MENWSKTKHALSGAAVCLILTMIVMIVVSSVWAFPSMGDSVESAKQVFRVACVFLSGAAMFLVGLHIE
jgi:hypothetical protein